MNIVLLIIEIYLLIGLVTALVIARRSAQEPCPLPWRWSAEILCYAAVVIFYWPWLLVLWIQGWIE
jgi:hypothetical protein